jgi:hypothetical protein
VLIGTAGVRWSDVDPALTPRLATLRDTAAIGVLADRTVRTSSCPVEGWVALSAGRRSGDAVAPGAADEQSPPCRAPDVRSGVSGAGPATVTGWQRYRDQAAQDSFSATPGLLGDALARAGTCALAIGPGAGVALARTDGTVDRYASAGGSASGSPGTSCPLTVVDAGTVRDPADAPRGPAEQGVATTSGDLAAQLRAVDARIGAALDAVPPGARVVVVSLADSGRTPALQLLAATGPGFGPGWLRTSSTRQDAMAQATDLTPTVLDLLGVPEPDALIGSPLTGLAAGAGAPSSAPDRLQKVLDLEQSAPAVTNLVGPFFTAVVALELLLLAGAALVWRAAGRRPDADPRSTTRTRRRALDVTWRALTVLGCVPGATYLANTLPWWRTDHHLLALSALTLAWGAVLGAVALLGPWRRSLLGPMGAAGALTALVIAGDVLTGSRLQTSSLLGLQPLVAGRFYGISNVAFALFATGALTAATAMADPLVRRGRRVPAAAAVAVIGLVAVVIDVAPTWGSDFGGPISLVPAVGVLTLAVLGVRLSWRKLLLIGAGTVALLTLVSLADWLRPADQRSHLGRFVQTLIDGGGWQVIGRKLDQNLNLLVSTPVALLVPMLMVIGVLVLTRPERWRAGALARTYERSPVLRPGLAALGIALYIGFAANDSGVSIPADGGVVVLPLLIAVVLRRVRSETTADPVDPADPAGPASALEPSAPAAPAAPLRPPG